MIEISNAEGENFMKTDKCVVISFIIAFVALSNSLSQTLGQLKWTVPTLDTVGGSPAIGTNGTVYITTMHGWLYSINSSTGQTNWNTYLNNTISLGSGDSPPSPAIGPDGTIYVCAADNRTGSLYAFKADGSSNQLLSLASYQVDESDMSTPAIGTNGTIYVTGYGYNPSLYAVNPNGSTKWTFSNFGSGGGPGQSFPVIGLGDTVYFKTESLTLCAVTNSGELKWTYPISIANFFLTTLAIGCDGTLYAVLDADLHAINPTNGTVKWIFQTGESAGIVSCPIIGPDGAIYVHAHDNLYAINSDGSKKWVFQTGGEINSSPALGADGTIYFGSADSNVFALYGSAPLANAPWPMYGKDLAHTSCQTNSACSGSVPLTVFCTSSGTNLILTWTGGVPLFTVECAGELPAGTWSSVVTTNARTASVPMTNQTAFFRIRSQ